MAAVLEYLACEVIELAGKAAKDNRKRRILPVHLKLAMRYDEEISKFLGNSVLAEGGGVHSNFSIDLLQTKKTTTKASSNDT
jgi:histone H2A